MVWPILPIVVHDKLPLTGVVAATLYGVGRWVGVSGFWGILAAPFSVGLYLRFLRRREKVRSVDDLCCAVKKYEAKKADVQATAKQIVESGETIRMFKKTASNTFRLNQVASRESNQKKLDLSAFNHLLLGEADAIQKDETTGMHFVNVEASMTFGDYVDSLLPLGFMPVVVPELKSITVGGAIVGVGLESSSFKHGLVHEGLREADVLLGTGEIITVSASQNRDLFLCIPNSLGSFGYLLRVQMYVQPVKDLVRITKTWYNSPEELVDGVVKACQPEVGNDFVDAAALSATGGMVIAGQFCNKDDSNKNKVSKYEWSNSPFYLTLVKEGVDYLTVKNYLWRYDSDWIWCTQVFPLLSLSPIRYLCGPDCMRSDQYKIFNDKIETFLQWTGINANMELVIQDIVVPVSKSSAWIKDFFDIVRSDIYGKVRLTRPGAKKATTPMWLCPLKKTGAALFSRNKEELYINFGFWDGCEHKVFTKGGMKTGLVNRALEAACPEHDAMKTLYSQCYYTEEDLYRIYNGDEYQKVKKKYDPNGALRSWHARLTGQ